MLLPYQNIHCSRNSFWQHNFTLLQEKFPLQFKTKKVEQFYTAINKVQPSLIRTEADEVTYHFHVMIRYEIEKLLIEGVITAKDIPSYWNEQYKKYLGITVPDYKRGCLQDVHWSHGSFGYFATYSIGSLYAAQFYATIKNAYPNIEKKMANGYTTSTWEWLKNNIYCKGRYFNSEQLCKRSTGKNLDISYFIDYIKNKFL